MNLIDKTTIEGQIEYNFSVKRKKVLIFLSAVTQLPELFIQFSKLKVFPITLEKQQFDVGNSILLRDICEGSR